MTIGTFWRNALAVAVMLVLGLPAPPAQAQRTGMSFQHFIETYDRMPPQRVLQILSALNRNQVLVLTSYARVSQDMLRMACQVRGDLWMDIQGTRTTCQQAIVDAQTALQWITPQQLRENIQSERNQMLIGLRCASGEIDRASCQAYFKTGAAVAGMMNQTGMRIIANIGNNCLVGVDPGCVAY